MDTHMNKYAIEMRIVGGVSYNDMYFLLVSASYAIAPWAKSLSVVPALLHSLSYTLRVLTAIIFVEIRCFDVRRRGSIRIVE